MEHVSVNFSQVNFDFVHPVTALCALLSVVIPLVHFFQPAGVDYHFELVVVGVWPKPSEPAKLLSVLRKVILPLLKPLHGSFVDQARLFLRSSRAEIPEGHLTVYRFLTLRTPRRHIIAPVLNVGDGHIMGHCILFL